MWGRCHASQSSCANRFVSRLGETAEHPGEKNRHVKNDDGGAVPTRNCTNWVVQGWADVVLDGGDGNDCSSTSVCENVSWSPSAELLVGVLAENWQKGSHTLGEVQRRDVRVVAAGAEVGWAENLHVLGRRGHCANVKKGREEEGRSFGEVVVAVERSASILSGL